MASVLWAEHSNAKYMKVTFCAHDRPGYLAGGPNAWLRRLLPDLRERGVECRVLFFNQPGDCPNVKALRDEGFDCSSIVLPRSTQFCIKWILDEIRRFPTDIFIPNLSVSGYYAGRWIKESGVPTIGVLHSDDDFHRGIQAEFLYGRAECRLSAVVCVSRFLEEQVLLQSPLPVLVRRIPYGVPLPDKLASSPTTGFRVAYVGRLTERQKRISEVTRAMCLASRDVPGTEYAIYGEGADRVVVENILAEYGRGLPVELVGAVDNGEIQDRLMQCHAIVLLSDYEGIPISLMEAMSCGVVPVCMDMRSGIPELVVDGVTGFLVKDRKEGFVAAIRRLKCESGLWQRLSTNARSRIETEYSTSVCAHRWVNLFQDLQKEKSGRKLIWTPAFIRLPPVNPSLEHEDCRQLPLGSRVIRKVSHLVCMLKRRVLGR
jgi:glycosyltransferase involved in cell wall biosynthesis